MISFWIWWWPSSSELFWVIYLWPIWFQNTLYIKYTESRAGECEITEHRTKNVSSHAPFQLEQNVSEKNLIQEFFCAFFLCIFLSGIVFAGLDNCSALKKDENMILQRQPTVTDVVFSLTSHCIPPPTGNHYYGKFSKIIAGRMLKILKIASNLCKTARKMSN